MSETERRIIILLLEIAALLFAFAGGMHAMEKEAVRQGHAEYYLDQDNNRAWRWKDK